MYLKPQLLVVFIVCLFIIIFVTSCITISDFSSTQVENNNELSNTKTSSITIIKTEPYITPSETSLNPIIPTRTPFSGEIIYSSNDYCQLVPEPEITDSNQISKLPGLTGTINLCWGWPTDLSHRTAIDLDTGFIGQQGDPESDLYFIKTVATIDDSIEYHFAGINGAKFFDVQSDFPDLNACKVAILAKPHNIQSIYEGFTTCWVTNEERLVFIKVEKMFLYGENSVTISFTTWNK